jgi:hypothetical protein
MGISALKNITAAKNKAKIRPGISMNENIWKKVKILEIQDENIESASQYIEDLIKKDLKKRGINRND